ncbi:MAG: oligosaccharide flippase family protein [bacterium]|nr:oligosaccharide flippase family protein [bacterium]
MKKEKFLISTIILIIGGALTKILGMLIRIVMTRVVGTEGISLYMLVFPTFSLFMTLSQLGFPIAISKLVSDDTHNNRNLILSIIPFSLMINIILILIILIIAPTLSIKLLNDYRCLYPIIAITIVLPFDSLSSIIRGYFFGKQKMIPHVVSNISEQIIRMILIILIIPKFLEKSLILAVSGLIGINMISELSSILVLFLFIPNKVKLNKKDIIPDKENVKDIFRIAIPTTGGRLIGSIGYFFEPILITLPFIIKGMPSTSIVKEYGIIEGYVMPLLLLPGFFTNAISSALLPVISNAFAKNKINYVIKKTKQACIYSLLIGIPITFFLMIFPKEFLNIIYNTKEGYNYIKILGPFFMIYYLQAPLASVLQSINLSKYIMIDNTISIIVRSIILFLGVYFMDIYGFLFAISANILIVTFLHLKHVKNALKRVK